MENNEVVTSTSRLNGLIKQKRNAEVKSILLKELPPNLINKRESTLVHTAVVFNNIDVIALLFSFGFDINAQNALGQTPLQSAAHNNSYRAIQLLLALDAEVFIDDLRGENVFQALLNKNTNTPAYIIGSLSERLRRSEVSPKKIADELVKADCPLERALKFNDVEVMREMLTRKNKIDEGAFWALVERAMHSENIENVRVILQDGPNLPHKSFNFIERVTKNIFDPVTRPFLEQIFNWELVDRMSLHKLDRPFTEGNEDIVQFILDIGIEKYCRERFGFEVLVSLFGNKNIDIAKVLRNRQFDIINSRDQSGNSALHVATANQNERAIVYLLEKGADPNVKDRMGQTALFFVYGDDDIAGLLLEAGADLQVISIDNESLITNDFAIANLMIAKARGIPINDKLHQWMFGPDLFDRRDTKLQDKCESHSQQLEWMKTRWVSKSITLFSVLTEKFERLARYLKDEKIIAEIANACEERALKPKYAGMLMKNLKRAREMNELKVKAATFLCDQMQIDSDDHLVIRVIIGFLTYKDLLVFHELEKTDACGSADEKPESDSSIERLLKKAMFPGVRWRLQSYVNY